MGEPASTHERPRPRRGGRFFVWIALAMLVVIALGFGKSFYLQPYSQDGALPVYLIMHGVVMTAWYLLFLAQACLVSAQRVDLHRQLGIAGVALAAAVVATGAMVHLRMIPRLQALGQLASPEELPFALSFVLAGLASLVPVVALVALAVWWRRRPATHKRLMFWAVVWTLGPAFSDTRPLGQFLDALVVPHLPYFPADLFWLAALLAYDWRVLRRIHPATWISFVLLALYLFYPMEWIARSPTLHAWLRGYLGV